MNTTSFPAGNSLHRFRDILRRQTLQPQDFVPDAYSAPVEAPRDPLHGSDEAKLRALAADLVRRRGAGEASRLADIFVGAVQMESRK